MMTRGGDKVLMPWHLKKQMGWRCERNYMATYEYVVVVHSHSLIIEGRNMLGSESVPPSGHRVWPMPVSRAGPSVRFRDHIRTLVRPTLFR